jgi:nucleoside-diphosphate-sugar epimerase
VRVIVTGGCGYVGSVLVPKLLNAGHTVKVVDLQWFGNHLEAHERLTVLKADFRTIEPECDAVIHLAAIANDPTGELDPALTWETNALGTMELAGRSKRCGVKHFIYASSGSVYGISDAPQVTEDLPLYPLSAYNKTKMVAERVVLSYRDNMVVQVVRPATVCGVSPRQRLDVVVNMLTAEAALQKNIVLNTPNAIRPHIHIQDMCGLYVWLLEHPEVHGVYNAGFENQTVAETAELVRAIVGDYVTIESAESKDIRSYRLNSDKLLNAGFTPKWDVEDAIRDVSTMLAIGRIQDTDACYNIRTMKCLQLA